MAKKTKIENIKHKNGTRKNIPTAELQNLVQDDEMSPKPVQYPRKNNSKQNPQLYKRDEDLDPQLVWLGKEEEDKAPLTVDAVPIYVQEHIDPKVIIQDIKRQAQQQKVDEGEDTISMFDDWSGGLDLEDKVEFYQHDQNWTNRFILGDSLRVMTSLAEKEKLRGQVQCIYMDPPYGISYASNWQAKIDDRTVGDGKTAYESREPEVIKAFRDTWQNGINSYLSYLRDRFLVCRDLLTESGSIFLQIGDENEHLVRSLLDEVMGRENFVSKIVFRKTSPLGSKGLAGIYDVILWYAKSKDAMKFRRIFEDKKSDDSAASAWARKNKVVKKRMTKEEKKNIEKNSENCEFFSIDKLSSTGYTKTCMYDFEHQGKKFLCGQKSWVTTKEGMERLKKADRIISPASLPCFISYNTDFPVRKIHNMWNDTHGATDPFYVVQTSNKVVQRCLLMVTDPGDLVLDPTCGSGTTAAVAEEWGRRWITIDSSRVAISLARSRLMGARYDWYVMNSERVSDGFDYKRVPHITIRSIAHNAEIDELWDKWRAISEPLRAELNKATGQQFEEWEIPYEADSAWDNKAKELHAKWLEARIGRQEAIDKSISDNADYENLYDQPKIEKGVLRVTGPFTVESLSPHRIMPTDAEDEVLLEAMGGELPETKSQRLRPQSEKDNETKFLEIVFEYLQKAGVQNTKKKERLEFENVEPWANGRHIQYQGLYKDEKGIERKAAICVGPEYGTVSRNLLVRAAREAADLFDVLIVLGFAFEAHASGDNINIGKMEVIRVHMNNDLHMADRLKAGKSGNLFVVFGEPDIELRHLPDNKIEVEIKGVDIYDPTTGEVKPSSPKDIACWFIDTNYDGTAFFVRHAYFSGGGPDPFKKLKTTLKAEVNQDAWDALYSTTSRPFAKPKDGQIAVKAINHFGDEVLKVFDVE